MKSVSTFLKEHKRLAIVAAACLAHAQGWCADSSEADAAASQLMESTNHLSNFLFGPVVRKIALTVGFGAGLFQAFMSGSIKPLVIYGGLGAVICILPKAIDMISHI